MALVGLTGLAAATIVNRLLLPVPYNWFRDSDPHASLKKTVWNCRYN